MGRSRPWGRRFLVMAALATAAAAAVAPAAQAARPSPTAPDAAPTAPAPAAAEAPSITISLTTDPATGQDVSFSGCQVGGGCATFTLDDDEDPSLASSMSAGGLAPGTYTVTQAQVPGWSLTDLVCSGAASVDLGLRRATITLGAGAAVACEFTNASPSITIAMSVDPASGQAFDFSGCQGSGCAGFTLDGRSADPTHPSSITAAVVPGTYTVTQSALPHWYLNAISCTSEAVDLDQRRVTITVDPGEHVRCRFDTVGRRITITQAVTVDDPQDFTFTSCRNADCGPFVLDADQADPTHPDRVVANDLADGTYVITQNPTPGWGLRPLTCSPGVGIAQADRRVTIEIPPGRGTVAECRFLNRTTSITIVQDSQPDDPQDFAFTGCSGSGCADFTLDDDRDPAHPSRVSATALAPGTYTVTQAAVEGWPLRRLSCNTGESVDLAQRRVTITLAAGDETVCWFTNGSPGITLVQDTEPNGPQDFVLQTCHLGTGCGTVALDDDDDPALPDVVHSTEQPDGTYWIRQPPVAGYTRPQISCGDVTGGSGVSPFADGVSFTLTSPNRVTCTFTNRPAGPPLTTGVAVSAGEVSACAVTATGGVRCWGGYGTVLPPSSLAVAPVDDDGNALGGIRSISVGAYFHCVLDSGGRVRCWGANSYGQLGDGSDQSRNQPPTRSDPNAAALTGATQISAGYGHACAVLQNGQARCWGWNRDGQLGDGTTTNRSRPVTVSNPDGSGPLTGVVQIAAGGTHTCARLTDGQARCWGAAALGDGTPPGGGSSSRPRVVSNPEGTGPLEDVAEVVVSSEPNRNAGHACARLQSGQVRCWGRDGSGQLGDGGGTSDRSRPVAVADVTGAGPLTDAAGLAAGDYHTCARLTNGEARCWGTSGSGQLGADATLWSDRPVVVVGPDGTGAVGQVTSITAGKGFTCATADGGPTRCWGQGLHGTLGTGSTHRWSRPVEVLTAP